MNGPTARQPAPVPAPTAQQAGEIRSRWDWVEAEVWTDPMLTALEQGVKGGKWFRLVDKVYALRNLRKGFGRVKANHGAAGVDRQTIEMFERELEANLEKLSQALKDGTFRPNAIKREWIPKPGSNDKRPLGIPTVRDRVAQTALRSVLEPIFERNFHEHSYGFRPKRSCKDALRRVDELLSQGYRWIVDVDLKSYFDTIPHDKLMERVREKIADGKVLMLIESFLKQGVLDGLKSWTPDAGTPQGAVISPLLSNIYLDPLDQQMARDGYEMVRYADDFVIQCRSEQEAREALKRVQEWTAQAGLMIHPEKTRIVYCPREEEGGPEDSFDFLGYRFRRKYKMPRPKSWAKIRDTIRDKTPRRNGQSLDTIIKDVNRTLCGWFEYYKHSAEKTFTILDGFIRRRLRSILMRRRQKAGHGWGFAHKIWPNAYFVRQGLMSLVQAHRLAVQSSRR
jgi:RNA-directed DNA polymerase